MARKHKLEEVLSALKAKGCVITLATPITKNVKVLDMPDHETASKMYLNWLKLNNRTHNEATFDEWASNPKTIKILSPRERNVTVVVQEPYTVNWEGCVLGNGSWGKVDYLVKAHGFRLTPSI